MNGKGGAENFRKSKNRGRVRKTSQIRQLVNDIRQACITDVQNGVFFLKYNKNNKN